MLRLIGLVVSIGLADSLNPTTIAPALYLATGDRPRARLIQFTLGVLVVYFVGGALIALGPGQLLLSLVPKPDSEDRHVIEVVVGAAMLVAAAVLWRKRESLAKRRMPTPKAGGKVQRDPRRDDHRGRAARPPSPTSPRSRRSSARVSARCASWCSCCCSTCAS